MPVGWKRTTMLITILLFGVEASFLARRDGGGRAPKHELDIAVREWLVLESGGLSDPAERMMALT